MPSSTSPTPPVAVRLDTHPDTPTRMAWVDLLRGFLVLAVVVYHCYVGALNEGTPVPDWVRDAMRALQPFRMPMLVMLSGMFLHRGLAKGPRRYLTGKLSALVVPYVGWFLASYFVFLAGTHRPSDRWYVEIVVPQTHLWFLCYLIGFFALAVPLRTPTLRLAALTACVAWLGTGRQDTAFHFVFYLGCFLLGSLVADPPAWLGPLRPRLSERWLSVAALVPVVWAIHTVLERDHTERTSLWLLPAFAGLLVGRRVALLVIDTTVGRWLSALGPATIVVFLVHTAVLAAFPAPARALTFGLVDSLWLSTAIAFVVSLGVVRLVRAHEEVWLLFDVRRGLRAISSRRA